MRRGETGPGIETTETSLEILESLRRAEGATITELADTLGVAKSTVYNHLQTLRNHGYVVREGTTYYPGFKLLNLGEYVRSRNLAYRIAAKKVTELSERTGEETDFCVESRGRTVRLVEEQVHHEHSVLTDRMIGSYAYMHSTAAGKAILATYSASHVEDILDEMGLPKHTENTITDRATLLDELDRIRDRGYALNDEESTVGLRCVSAAATGPDAETIGAFSVSGPVYRIKDDTFREEIPSIVLSVVGEFERELATG